jgi:hypothetical protein
MIAAAVDKAPVRLFVGDACPEGAIALSPEF